MATLDDVLGQLDPATQAQVRATLNAGALIRNIITADPEAARTIEQVADKAAKKVNPAHMTIEDRAAPIVERIMATVDAKLAERDKKAEDSTMVDRLNQQIADAKSKYDFTDEGITNVLSMMKDKGIADFDSAMKAYRYDNPSPSSAPQTAAEGMFWNVDKNMQNGDAKDFFFRDGIPTITENPEMWEKETALAYLNGRVSLPAS